MTVKRQLASPRVYSPLHTRPTVREAQTRRIDINYVQRQKQDFDF